MQFKYHSEDKAELTVTIDQLEKTYYLQYPKIYNSSTLPLADTDFTKQIKIPKIVLKAYGYTTIYPNHVIAKNNELLAPTFKKHRHHKHGGLIHMGEDTYQYRNNNINLETVEDVTFPVFYGDTEYPNIYGHDLLEVLVNAFHWQDVRAKNIKFVTTSKKSNYLMPMLNAIGLENIDFIELNKPIRTKQLFHITPLIKLRSYVHPSVHNYFNMIGSKLYFSSIQKYKKVYISRSRLSERKLVNEIEIEKLFEKYGFHVVHPQDLTIQEQVTIFMNADFIAGAGGSAMHNIVFSKANAKILLLTSEGWFTIIDSLLDHGFSRIGYVLGKPLNVDSTTKRTKSNWHISKEEVERAINLHLS